MKITTIGNCQAKRIGEYIKEILPNTEVIFLSPTSKVLQVSTEAESEKAIKTSDLIIRQPLSSEYGILCSETTKAAAKGDTQIVNFAYFFNSGFASLCHAPAVPTVFGQDVIHELCASGYATKDILDLWSNCSIDFRVKERFQTCLDELRRRESTCEIKTAEFIHANHTSVKLFDTHNHPTKRMFVFYLKELKNLGIIPSSLPLDSISETDLTLTACPLTPRDQEEHEYLFAHDQNWESKGRHLIEQVILRNAD